MIYKRELRKADGRGLLLFGREPLTADLTAPSPDAQPANANPHLRWHPLRSEWVAYAGYRQHRTFLPPPEYNPLGVSRSELHPTEVPAGPWDVAVFENRFPTFAMTAHDAPSLTVATAPARGVCEVVVFTQDPTTSLATLPLAHLEVIVEVWADRYRELGSRPEIAYVFPFENRGVEVGVTLPHPHGQIYAYPFVPPVAARELDAQRMYLERHGRGLVEDLIANEIADQQRLLYHGSHVAAFVPICARYAYEVWIAPLRPVASFAALDDAERRDFARALKTTLLKFDGLWQRPFPYILAFHQAPTDGAEHPEAHLHAEFYPAYRMPDRLKYLAGSEIGAGVFTADTLPEQSAAELRRIDADVDK